MPRDDLSSAPTTVVYDGHCPFCASYVSLLALKEAVGPVELVDARASAPWRARLEGQGVDLNQGFVVVHRGRLHVGAEALAFIAQASAPTTVWSRLNRRLFARPAVARAAYPVLRLGRAISLRLLGRGAI